MPIPRKRVTKIAFRRKEARGDLLLPRRDPERFPPSEEKGPLFLEGREDDFFLPIVNYLTLVQ